MKDQIYIEDKEKNIRTTKTAYKPVVVALTILVILILLLNLITTLIF